jgi:hypothetical protein
MIKRVIQVYKSPNGWINSPPGLGDFVRGIVHLSELVESYGVELRVDVSQTDFYSLIVQNPAYFQSGDPVRIAAAVEYFVDHQALVQRLDAFSKSEETELYICTNLGGWNRTNLSSVARFFGAQFYCFTETVECGLKRDLPVTHYEVLSLRCGDSFYGDSSIQLKTEIDARLCDIIENEIIPHSRAPIVVTSDNHRAKLDLVNRYGFLALPHHSQHGAFGNVMPVAMDLCMLRDSRFNYHINSWATWWSGFSHYTSLIFRIPSMNFRAPSFQKEEIGADGQID